MAIGDLPISGQLDMEKMDDSLLSNSSTANVTYEEYTPIIEKFKESLLVYDQLQNYVLIFTYIPLFLIALTSNVLVILVVSRYRCLRSVTNYFLVNLSVADLLVTLLCMPMAVGKAVTSLWLYGEIMCKLSHYLQGVAVSASVFTITAMSIDRYLAIRHPMSRKIINRKTTRKVILVLWTIALLIFAPILMIRKFEVARIQVHGAAVYEFPNCVEHWPDNWSRRTFGIFCFIMVYAIPGCVVVIAYSLMGLRLCSRQLLPEYQLTTSSSPANAITVGTGRNNLGHTDSGNPGWQRSYQVSAAGGRLIRERRRVAKILLILALVFAFCWMPYSVLSLLLDIKSHVLNRHDDPFLDLNGGGGGTSGGVGNNQTTANHDDSLMYDSAVVDVATSLLPFAILLGHVNSAVNPLLYCLLSKNFRRSVTDLIRHPRRAVRNRPHCKIRMTFRRDPPPSADALSSNNKPEPMINSRPRNHHAPEPSKGTSSPFMDAEAGEICIVDMGQNNVATGATVAYSPSSSGYSSLRQSTDTLANSFINKEYHYTSHCHSYPHAIHYHGSYPLSSVPSSSSASGSLHANCNGKCIVIGAQASCPGSSQISILPKRCCCPESVRKVHVPSTIREESDSCHSQKSRSNVSTSRVHAPM